MTQSFGAVMDPRVAVRTPAMILSSVLSCAIFAHEGDAVLLIDLEGNVFEQGGAAKLDGQSIYCDHVGFLIFLLLLVFSSHYLSQYKPGVHGHGGEEAVVAAHDLKPFAE